MEQINKINRKEMLEQHDVHARHLKGLSDETAEISIMHGLIFKIKQA